MLYDDNTVVKNDKYQEQSIFDLCIILGHDEFCLSEDKKSFFVEGKEEDVFTIHEWKEFSVGDFNISVFILGESHAVMVRYKSKIIFFEICACTKLKNKKTKPLYLKDLKDDEVLGLYSNGHTYALKKEYLNHNKLMEMYDFFDILSNQESAILLEYNFCYTKDRNHDIEPMTKVIVRANDKDKDKEVRIQSIHVYPEETDKNKIAVLTDSVLIMNS